MQEYIGNLTVEQFSQLVGTLIGCVIMFFCFWVLISAMLHSILDGWLFRKGALYYGSFRYLNKLFKRLRNCGTIDSLESVSSEIVNTINLLLCQRVIHKFTFDKLNSTFNYLYEKRRIEISSYWKGEFDQ